MAVRIKPLPKPVAKVIEVLPPDLRYKVRKGVVFPRIIIPFDDQNRLVFSREISAPAHSYITPEFEMNKERLKQINPELELDPIFRQSTPILSYHEALEIYLKRMYGIKFGNRNIKVIAKSPAFRPKASIKELQIRFPRYSK